MSLYEFQKQERKTENEYWSPCITVAFKAFGLKEFRYRYIINPFYHDNETRNSPNHLILLPAVIQTTFLNFFHTITARFVYSFHSQSMSQRPRIRRTDKCISSSGSWGSNPPTQQQQCSSIGAIRSRNRLKQLIFISQPPTGGNAAFPPLLRHRHDAPSLPRHCFVAITSVVTNSRQNSRHL